MRASNADAAVYYLARMVEAGEDPLFIARRMVIFASEDIGLAQPTALVVANEIFKACQVIGYPECAINLAHGVAYLANSQKRSQCLWRSSFCSRKTLRVMVIFPFPLSYAMLLLVLTSSLVMVREYKKYGDKDFMPRKTKGKEVF